MKQPIKNRIRAEYIIPQHYIDRDAYAANIPAEMIVERMTRELMQRITNELIQHKHEAIETIRYDGPLYTEVKQRIELFVFTRDELDEFINHIKEQITAFDNWENK